MRAPARESPNRGSANTRRRAGDYHHFRVKAICWHLRLLALEEFALHPSPRSLRSSDEVLFSVGVLELDA